MKINKTKLKKGILYLLNFKVFIISFALFAALSPWYIKHVDLNGDEPHYLAITQSLVAHHTFNLKEFYQNKEWKVYVPAFPNLDKHITKNSTSERIISIHQPGFSIVLVPAYLLGLKVGAIKLILMMFTSILGALIVQNIFLYLKEHKLKKTIIYLVTFSMMLTYPLMVFSHLMFSDIFSALLVIYGFRGKNDYLRILAIAYLPWVHLKYILIMLILGLKFLLEKKKYYLTSTVIIGSLILFSIFSRVYYGSFFPFGNIQIAGGFGSAKGIFWLLSERSAGLLNYAPYLVLVFMGLPYFFINYKKEFIFWLLVVAVTFITNGIFLDWMGGMSPPARYLTTVIPLFSLPIGFVLNYAKKYKILTWLLFLLLLYFSLRVSYHSIKVPIHMYLNRPANISYYFPFNFDTNKLFPSFCCSSFYPYLLGWSIFISGLVTYGYFLINPKNPPPGRH